MCNYFGLFYLYLNLIDKSVNCSNRSCGSNPVNDFENEKFKYLTDIIYYIFLRNDVTIANVLFSISSYMLVYTCLSMSSYTYEHIVF